MCWQELPIRGDWLGQPDIEVESMAAWPIFFINHDVWTNPCPGISTFSSRGSTTKRQSPSNSRVVVSLMWTLIGSPAASTRAPVFTVSPNRRYRGIFSPVMAATHGPVCRPIRIFRNDPGKWGISKSFMEFIISRDIDAISPAWRSPFLSGRPDTTIYASPMVATL